MMLRWSALLTVSALVLCSPAQAALAPCNVAYFEYGTLADKLLKAYTDREDTRGAYEFAKRGAQALDGCIKLSPKSWPLETQFFVELKAAHLYALAGDYGSKSGVALPTLQPLYQRSNSLFMDFVAKQTTLQGPPDDYEVLEAKAEIEINGRKLAALHHS